MSAPNVLLEALSNHRWKAKLSDFGSANLAKIACTAGEGAIIYTPPEAFPVRDPKAVIPQQTTKIDVFSYGVLLCEVITNQLPVQEDYQSMLRQVQRQWRPMYDLIISCTETKPEQRPTMEVVLKQLKAIPQPRSDQKDPSLEIAQLKQQYQLQLQREREVAVRTEQALREELQQERAQARRTEERRRVQIEQLQRIQKQGATKEVAAAIPVRGRSVHGPTAFQDQVSRYEEVSPVPKLHVQLSIGSKIQLSDPPRYGVIRWIGELPRVEGLVAGIELVSMGKIYFTSVIIVGFLILLGRGH